MQLSHVTHLIFLLSTD